MIRNASTTSYSAEVRITLRVGERVFDVAQVHNTACYLRNPADVPAGPAELMISVDGRESLENVILRDGIKADSPEVCFG
ncbi:MAG: hypothetical protein IT422_18680 [Pirellulaceae bacterium]|nr:hypothetical protein [Pirellulaceae bacterium]